MVMQNHQASKNQDFKILLAKFFTVYNPGLGAKYHLVMNLENTVIVTLVIVLIVLGLTS
jgi:hypothetical protein